MIYDYSTVKSKPVKYETISIRDGQYQVPSQVAKELTNMANIIEAQNIDINEARAKRREENEAIADLIVMNLISGEPYGNSVLKHGIDHFTRMENDAPVFDFRDDVYERVILGLDGVKYADIHGNKENTPIMKSTKKTV